MTFTKIAAATAFLSIGVYTPQSQAALISYDLFWEGNAGYTATGMFSYDDQFEGGTITSNELNDLMISFFDPSGTELQSFFYPPFTPEFNFNFDTTTETILQTGNFDEPDGFDLGVDAGQIGVSGIDFYSCNNGSGGCDFSLVGQGIILQQDNGSNSCVDPTDPNCVQLDNGGVFIANRKMVPENTSIISLLTIGIVGGALTFQKRFKLSKFRK
ncbi:MAG: hypothetical protein AB4063_14940 [Crocosphaera sp.]